MLPPQTHIHQSRSKMLLVLLAGLCLTATAVWLLTGEVRHRFAHPLLVVFAGAAGALLFGAASVAALIQLVRPRLALTLDHQGLTDHARNGFGAIAWKQILGIASINIAGQRMLVVRVKDPQWCIDQASHRLRRASLTMNLKTLGSPVVISASALQLGCDALLDLCRRYLDQHGNA